MGGALGTHLKAGALYALLVAAVAVIGVVAFVGVFDQEVTVDGLVMTARRVDHTAFPVPTEETVRHPARHVAPPLPATDERPRNVILVLGDGMGLGEISTLSTLLEGPAGGLSFESAEVIGLVRTWTATDLVTDSAAAGSAMATGLKTAKKTVATQPDGSEPQSIFDAAESLGMATGFVTTSGLADATPASFLAHARSRYDYASLLDQILHSDADVLIGGTFEQHLKAGNQPDYLELVGRAEEVAGGSRNVVRTGGELATAAAPLVALFPPRPGRRYAHGPPLAESAARALELLSADPDGYLLVVECEETDEGAHANDLDRVLEGIRELDAAVLTIFDAVRRQGDDTLVIVTSDHDTAELGIAEGPFDGGVADVRWMTDDHLATWVPLFAFGPGATRFSGVMDNTEIGIRIADLLGIEGFPSSP